MADDTSASVFHLHQPRPKRAKTAAERARAYRERKKAAEIRLGELLAEMATKGEREQKGGDRKSKSHKATLIPAPKLADLGITKTGRPLLPVPAPVLTPVTPLPPTCPETGHVSSVTFAPVRVTKRHVTSVMLTLAALALGAVGMTMNGWFARSLGSTDAAGWLFLAVGVAADLVALVMPSCAAGLWQAHQRATAVAGWAVWAVTFSFAITAGIGFASVNIADVTMSRASRSTPAIVTAQAALADAMASRDRECRGGVGRFCREREAAVIERRQAVDTAMGAVAAAADPQTDAAVKIVAWASLGALRPSGDDFAMLRLVLLALLPQIGGVLLMVGRRA